MDVPAFTLDPANQPSTCGSGSSTPVDEVNYFNPAFRFPTNFRVALGTDLHLPWGLVGTVDLLYILGVDQYYVNDVNLQTPTAVAAGEGGRVLYGTIDSAGDATPNRVSTDFGHVLEITNASGDRSFSGTVQLQKRWSNGAELGLAYTYTDSKDRMAAPGDLAAVNMFNILDGTLADRNLATSYYSVPNKITLRRCLQPSAPLSVLPVLQWLFRYTLYLPGSRVMRTPMALRCLVIHLTASP